MVCKAINRKQLPVKAHWFFFMAAMGPILPYLPVYGKQLGISAVVMGSITAILPLIFLIAKPTFGILVDHHYKWRKCIFMVLLGVTSCFYVLMYLLPAIPGPVLPEYGFINETCTKKPSCASLNISTTCKTGRYSDCHWTCNDGKKFNTSTFFYTPVANLSSKTSCLMNNFTNITCEQDSTCHVMCDHFKESCDFYLSFTFWGFVALMSLGNIGFNVANSISDAISFDVLGEHGQTGYGRQRVWGTIGFGISALLAGYAIELWSQGAPIKIYTPAFILVAGFSVFDLLSCIKLKLPDVSEGQSIMKEVCQLVLMKPIAIFLFFAMMAGILDSFLIYFLLWYMEDLAAETGYMSEIKLIEGLTIAAETLGSEVIVFLFSGKILKALGYGKCFIFCFLCYALRLGLISLAPSPWWIVLIELFMQGPTYALCYTTIVAYASVISPPGTSATVQGIVAGMDDGLGFSVGSFIGGILYKKFKGVVTLRIFASLAVLSAAAYTGCYLSYLKNAIPSADPRKNVTFKSPEEAQKECVDASAQC